MIFTSIDFMIFFPIVACILFVVPKKCRYIWLLAASYYFYMSWNPLFAVFIGTSTLITYVSSLFIEKCNNKVAMKKMWLAGSVVSNLGILALLKYADFFLINLSKALSIMHIGTIDRRFDLLLPIGISIYTLQVISYTVDVYKGEIKAEKNLLKYALYVSFFPKIIVGPIEHSKNLLAQIQNIEKISVWNFDRVSDGILLMVWGLFQKLVIADRAAILVNTVIGDYNKYGFVEISLAMILFAFQIYCDFAGYTNIARGAAKVMGFELMNNFKQPYLATSIKDFWKRWYVSLTSWFTDYVYLPLGGDSKGAIRQYVNLVIVFGAFGLWHGASWNFVVWGLILAFYIICGQLKQIGLKKLGKEESENYSLSARVRKIIVTFVLVDFAWIFFAAASLKDAVAMIKQMKNTLLTTSLYELGLNRDNMSILLWALVILFAVDVLHNKKISIANVLSKQECWFRWIIYVGAVWMIILFGIYGEAFDLSKFTYFQY